MKRKKIISLAGIILGITIISALIAFSSATPWKYVSGDAYKLVKAGNGKHLAYRILQDKDKEDIRAEISEQGVDGEVFKENWKELRKDLTSSLNKIKSFGADDTLVSTQIEDFEVSFDALGGDSVWKFKKVKGEDRSLVIPEEADNLPFEFAAGGDGSKCLAATEKGLWKIDADSEKAERISEQSYNGKSYEELLEEMNSGITSEDEFNALFWNSNPVVNPDGTKVVYSSNRDCTAGGGYSLWLYDFETGEEKVIAQSEGEYYICRGWLDVNTVICQRSYRDEHTYCSVDDNGNINGLDLGSEYAEVLCTGAGFVAYTPDNSVSNEVCIAKYDPESKELSSICQNQTDGVLRGNGSFDKEGTKFAYLYAPDEDETLQYMAVVNLSDGNSTLINQLPARSRARSIISGFDWIGSGKLFVNIATANDGLMQESSWVYTIEGGK